MWHPWNSWKAYRLERLRIQTEAQTKPFEAMVDLVKEVMAAQREQTKVFESWLDMFRVKDVPSSTVVTDQDEYMMELIRTGQVPDFQHMTPDEQAAWWHSIDADLDDVKIE